MGPIGRAGSGLVWSGLVWSGLVWSVAARRGLVGRGVTDVMVADGAGGAMTTFIDADAESDGWWPSKAANIAASDNTDWW